MDCIVALVSAMTSSNTLASSLAARNARLNKGLIAPRFGQRVGSAFLFKLPAIYTAIPIFDTLLWKVVQS
jgi:hypothetical protein